MSAQLDKGGGQPRGLGSPASLDRPVPGLLDAPGGVPRLMGHSWQSLRSCRFTEHLLCARWEADSTRRRCAAAPFHTTPQLWAQEDEVSRQKRTERHTGPKQAERPVKQRETERQRTTRDGGQRPGSERQRTGRERTRQ